MTTSGDDPVKKLLAKLAGDREKIEELLDSPSDGAPLTDQDRAAVNRLCWILRAALAHSQGSMPWRAKAPTEGDSMWVDQVCHAVRDKRARPPHPDADIEQMLMDALPS
jgi:hypothetical protein